MNFIKRWNEKRKDKKEFEKILNGIIGAMREMIFFEPNTRATHEHAEILTKNMFLANGCDDVNISIFAYPEYSNVTKAKINLVYREIPYEISMIFKPLKLKNSWMFFSRKKKV
jgi:hypothetical protein